MVRTDMPHSAIPVYRRSPDLSPRVSVDRTIDRRGNDLDNDSATVDGGGMLD
ncbi:MAG TPA: hypothetical protein PLI95_10905 [Polyangiaceae bacterium]|nr:hypothetical protein [Polyangiaceae bacterium]